MKREDKIPGGLADDKKPNDFNAKALKAGIKVEMEHTSDKKVAMEIAMDHLTEDPKYYEKLATIEKGFTKQKYRRKVPKVTRWYKRHREEDKTFDKSEEEGAEDLEKKQGVPTGVDPAKHERCVKEVKKQGKDKSSAYAICNASMKKSQETNMPKSINEEIEEMAKSMETATIDPFENLMETVQELGPEGIKKALPNMNDTQKKLLKSVLENMNKSVEMDDVYDGDRKFAKVPQLGTEIEDGSDDEDEKLVKEAAAAQQNHQGNNDPEGFEGQVIKSEDPDVDSLVDSILEKSFGLEKAEKKEKDDGDEKKEAKIGKKIESAVDEMAEEEAEEAVEEHEKEMHSKKDKKMEKSEIQSGIEELTKSFDGDMEMVSDYLYMENDQEAESFLLEKAKTVSRNGMRYYAEGPNSGKLVGSVRGGAGASMKAIARAKKKGKISAKGAKEGMKQAKENVKDVKDKEKAGSYASEKFQAHGPRKVGSQSGSLESARKRAAKRLADKKVGLSSKDYQAKQEKHIKEQGERSKPAKEAGEKIQYNKDGSAKQTKKNKEAIDKYSQAKGQAKQSRSEADRAFNKVRKETKAAQDKKEKQLTRKRNKMMKKSELTEVYEEVVKSLQEEGIEPTQELIKSEMMEVINSIEVEEESAPEEINKSVVYEKDETSLLKACTLGRNYHFSINNYYDEAIRKSAEEGSEEDLTKSEDQSDAAPSIDEIIAKGMDQDADSIKTERILKAQKMSGNFSKSFSEEDFNEAMGVSSEEAAKILGEDGEGK